MVVVFLSFVLTPDVWLKQIGLGLAAAVQVDATVVRLVLVPAVVELLGQAAAGSASPAASGRKVRNRQAPEPAEAGARTGPALAPVWCESRV